MSPKTSGSGTALQCLWPFYCNVTARAWIVTTEMNPLNPAVDGPVALTPHKNEWPRDRKTDQDDRNVRPRIGGPEPRPPGPAF